MTAKRQSFIKGAMILTAATVIVKIIGMLYKIPLGNILGAIGMSCFMTAYNIFNPIYALSVAGFPVAVSKMVSESVARGRYRETKKILKASFRLFVVTGLLGSVIMFAGADFGARLVNNPGAAPAIRAMSPAILFCCVVSAYRGYYQGLGSMTPTAVSQVLESIFKLVCGIVFALRFYNREIENLIAISAVPRSEAEFMALPHAAAGAVLGVTASTAISAVYLIVLHLSGHDKITAATLMTSPKPPESRQIVRRLAGLALPVCIGSVLTQITSLIDVATIMNRIRAATQRGGDVVLAMYGNAMPPEVTLDTIPSFLYGAYGYCSSLFNLVPALTIPLGISILPLISSHWALSERKQTAVQVQSLIKMSSLLAIPAGLGLSALADPILTLLYPARISEAAIAAPMLRSLGIAAALVGITAPVNSVFQAVGRADVPVKLMAIGASLKLAMNYFLIAIPGLNINAAPYGTILCYFFIFIASLIALQNILGIELDLVASFFKPLACGIICGISAYFSYGFFARLITSRAVCLISVLVGGVVYLIFVLLFRIVTKKEVFLLPKGEKIAKTLEKLALLR